MSYLRYISILIIYLVCQFGSVAETVSQKEASRIAEQFFNERYGRVMQKPKLAWNGKRLTTDNLFTPFYVYNHPAGGYVIIAADNKAFPILGFNLNENFNPEQIDDARKAILKSYALDIEDIRYDSRIPYEAIEAWNNIERYIHDILSTPSEIYNSTSSPKEALATAEEIVALNKDDYFSDIYTPSQWESLIGTQLIQAGNVKIGIALDRRLAGAVIDGKKGDYFRIQSTDNSLPFMRLSATEYFTPLMVADLIYTPEQPEIEEPDDAFRFYEDFVEETRAAEEASSAAYQMELINSQPKIYSNGGGHFQIRIPAQVKLLRVFNIAGSIVAERYFKDTDTATIDLSGDASGFYIALIISDSGKPYSFKIYR